MEMIVSRIHPNIPTELGHIYSKDELKKAIDVYNAKDSKIGHFMPNYKMLTNEICKGKRSYIYISHAIKSIKLIKGNIVADLEILDTDSGKKLNHVFKVSELSNKKLAELEMIAWGGIENNYVKNLTIIGFDFVGVE